MAVFTPVRLEDLQNWITPFGVGRPVALKGISSGIENSNFFLSTENNGHREEYVLTLFEKLTAKELPYYLQLMRHLALRQIPVPAPATTGEGELFLPLRGKPAAIVSKLHGQSNLNPAAIHSASVGAMLARMHIAGQDFDLRQPNLRGLDWWQETVPAVLPFMTQEQADMLRDELAAQTAFAATADYANLPYGAGHCDLFRNNVMFDGDQLTGFFDFYFAGDDHWLFDLAVTVNDWCIDLDTGTLDMDRALAMLNAYQQIRPITATERACWNLMLRAAALRFWLSRLYDYHLPRDADMLTAHDPQHFERILALRRRDAMPFPPQ